MITSGQLANAYSYESYKALLEELLTLGKTTGQDQSEAMVNYARLNVQRLARVDKTLRLDQKTIDLIATVREKFIWVVLTEGWCSDTAQSVPVFAAMARLSPHIEVKLLLRDDNPDVMNQYLTNGARSIPKLICIRQGGSDDLFTWGPRPEPLQTAVMRMLKEGVGKDERGLLVQKWYNADKGATIQAELYPLIRRHMTGK